MREGELPAARLQLLAAGVEHVDRQGAEARGRGDRAALVHELDERRRGAADRRTSAPPAGGAPPGGGGTGGAPLPSIAASTSSFVTRPRGPLPLTAPRSSPWALAMRAATGVALPPFPADGARRGRRRSAVLADGSIGAAASAAGAGAGSDAAEHRAHLHGLVGLDEDLGDRPGHRRGHLGVDLVGGDLDQHVVDRDGVARLHAPLEHGALGHGVAHLGEGDVDRLGLLGRRPTVAGRGCRSVSTHLDLAQRRPHLHGLVGLGKDLRQRASGGRRHLGVDLVGGHLDQWLVRLNAIADLLQPLENGPLGDRFAHLGHRDLHGRRASCHSHSQL